MTGSNPLFNGTFVYETTVHDPASTSPDEPNAQVLISVFTHPDAGGDYLGYVPFDYVPDRQEIETWLRHRADKLAHADATEALLWAMKFANSSAFNRLISPVLRDITTGGEW